MTLSIVCLPTGCGAGDTQSWVKQEDTLQEEEDMKIKVEVLDQEFALTHNTAGECCCSFSSTTHILSLLLLSLCRWLFNP